MKFKVGDRVICSQSVGRKHMENQKGKIIDPTSFTMVEFDKNIGGHSGGVGAQGKNGHCWGVPISSLKRISTNIWKGGKIKRRK